jgi:hypothetical protein
MGTVTLTIENFTLEPTDFRDLCAEFLDLLMDLTPVDTGTCRDSWVIEGWAESEATFFNSPDYSSFLDEGWSEQAPDGMTGPALEQLDDLADKYDRSFVPGVT